MKVTIRKIAALAGVSRGTVDKVIHNRPGVSDAVRAKVRAIIEEQGYRPPAHHRAPEEKPPSFRLSVPVWRMRWRSISNVS